METTLAQLKVEHGTVEDEGQRAQLVKIRQTLPHQRAQEVVEEAALRFGLPMTGQEIHEQVRQTLRPRWRLPIPARIGVMIFLLVAGVFLGYFAPWAIGSLRGCTSRCEDPTLGLVASLLVGLIALLAAAGIFSLNLIVLQRTSIWNGVELYTGLIPDIALLKLAEAKDSSLFKSVFVVEPSYAEPTPRRHVDPWLVGSVAEHESWAIHPSGDARRVYVVLAYWD